MTTSSTAIALRTHSALAAARTLDDLDDDDALAVGLAFKRPSLPLLLSILGVGGAVALGALTLGTLGACVVGAVASAGAGLAAQHGARDKLRVELGVSAADAKRLFAATAHWRAAKLHEPRSDDEVRAFGRFIIDKARAR
jgi:hypothetical protein